MPAPESSADASRGASWRTAGSPGVLALAALLVLAVPYLFGAHVPLNEGYGWDGLFYGDWVERLGTVLFTEGLDDYYLQRVLPPALVHGGLLLTHQPLDTRHVVGGFTVLNLLSAAAAAWAMGRAALALGLDTRRRWLLAAGFVLSYAVVRWGAFVPVLTDMPALAIGAWTVTAWLERRPLLLAAITVAGAFSWPTALVAGAVLLVLPRPAPAPDAGRGPGGVALWPHTHLVASVLCAGLVLDFVVSAVQLHASGYPMPFEAVPVAEGLFPVSLAAAAAWLAAAFWPVMLQATRLGRHPEAVLRRVSHTGLATALLLFAGVRLTIARMAAAESPFTFAQRLDFTLASSIARPGAPFVALVVFYGPLVLLAVCLWPRVVRRAAALGEGALVLVALAPAIALCAEPRGILNLFPMLAVLAAAELPDLSRPRARLFDAVFIASALAASKLWLPLDVGPFTSHPLDWPDQRLFLSSGPWMLASTYWPQAAAAVVLLGVFAWLVHSPTWPSGRGAA